ncbi:GapA-binding peptide SR1P [Paenibacillus alba]|uniref:GapA-binding peptide SR1P n=1 Tax=Paenibacillus alba TaxID=1197127 RepID=A0ABU6FWD8_9BACL|nr:GapA-binding peptide SR1P [Paenibacillus alba]MEC0226192.1 GapA-binding peptide SR1P [Paenibacillus alba]NQX68649.1 GapA-binding peptide SR1P [Paenibacillus alba]
MSQTNHVKLAAIHRYDLGVVICKLCNEVIATLPTDGYKKFYGLCNAMSCIEKNKEENKK